MGFRITYPIPAAIGGGAAFTGGQGELLKYLQGMQLQYDRLSLDDMQQQRALAFQAAQHQNAIRARLSEQQLGAALDFRRMGMQADLAREGRAFAGEEAEKNRAAAVARDKAMADRRMGELEFGRAAELADAGAMLDGMEGELLGGMDTSVLPDGPLKTRIGELSSALDEVKSDPKYNEEQRIAARRRIVGELNALTGSYKRQAKPPKTMEEEWESNVVTKPEGVLIRQPDGSLDYRPPAENPQLAMEEHKMKMKAAARKERIDLRKAKVDVLRDAVKDLREQRQAATDAMQMYEDDSLAAQEAGKPLPKAPQLPSLPELDAQIAEQNAMMLRTLQEIDQEIEESYAEQDEIDAEGEPAGQLPPEAPPPEQAPPAAGPVIQGPPAAGPQGPLVPPAAAQQQQAAPQQAAQPTQREPNDGMVFDVDGWRPATDEEWAQQAQFLASKGIQSNYPAQQQQQQSPNSPPPGFAHPGGDASKVPLPVVNSQADLKRLGLKKGDLVIWGPTGETAKVP